MHDVTASIFYSEKMGFSPFFMTQSVQLNSITDGMHILGYKYLDKEYF